MTRALPVLAVLASVFVACTKPDDDRHCVPLALSPIGSAPCCQPETVQINWRDIRTGEVYPICAAPTACLVNIDSPPACPACANGPGEPFCDPDYGVSQDWICRCAAPDMSVADLGNPDAGNPDSPDGGAHD